MSEGEQTFDDLTRIRGIGPARQEWLRKALSITTFAELAGSSIDEIDENLKADGHIVARSDIESWILEARELREQEPGTAYPVNEASVEAVKEAYTSNRNGDWKPYASFVVEFQERSKEGEQTLKRTAVHHIETDRGAFWQGAESEKLCLWMLQQSGEMAKVAEAGEIDAAMPSTAAPVKVQINRVRPFQPPSTGLPAASDLGEEWPATLRRSEPFNLGISFSLTGETARSLSRTGARFRIKAYATEVASASSFALGEPLTGSLREGQTEYQVLLSESTLKRGSYRFWTTVVIQAAHTFPDLAETSELTVA